MIETRTIISDVQGDFEGGNSLSVDWDSLLRRATRTVTREIRPETLKRTVPIYAGLSEENSAYYCPDNVLVPSLLYTHGKEEQFQFMPPKIFYSADNYENSYTIEYRNGARFIVVKGGSGMSGLTIDEMEVIGTKTGGNPVINEQLKVNGSASIGVTFTEAGIEFGDNTTLDISDYLRGAIILPAYIPTALDLESLEFRLKTDDSNYYSVTSLSDSIGDFITDGWNNIKFGMAGATQTGTPDATNITEWSIIGTTKAGKTMTIYFDKITLQKYAQYFLEFYSSAPFVDGKTGEMWKKEVSYLNNDKILFDNDVIDLLHYELCLLVTQSSTFDRIDSQATQRFDGQLKRAYQEYWLVHPSSEEPMSFNTLDDYYD